MNRMVTVSAPIRLHFGLLNLTSPHEPRFGGVGMMLDPSLVELNFSASTQLTVDGCHADRARDTICRVAGSWNIFPARLPPYRALPRRTTHRARRGNTA